MLGKQSLSFSQFSFPRSMTRSLSSCSTSIVNNDNIFSESPLSSFLPSLLPPDLVFLSHDCPSSQFQTSFPVLDPCKSSENPIAFVSFNSHAVTSASIRDTIEKQKLAFRYFKETPSQYRAKLLSDLSGQLHANKNDLATIMSLESGKPLRESLGEVAYSASYCLILPNGSHR